MSAILTMDDARFDADRTYLTHDGLTVRVSSTWDEFPWCEYPGSTMRTIDELCPGLVDIFDEEITGELPTCKRTVFSPYGITNQSLKSNVVRLLLSGQQKARIPLREVAKMAGDWALWDDKLQLYQRGIRDGLEDVTVSIYRDETLVHEKTLHGVTTNCQHIVEAFERETIDEARELDLFY